MKLGTSVWSFPSGWDLEKILKTASEIGYDGVEVALGKKGLVSLESTNEDLDKVKELAKKHQIELYSVASSLYWDCSLTSNDSEVRQKAKAIVKKQLEAAAYLGCDTILVVPGCVSEVTDYDIAFDRALEWLNELKPVAERLGVSIGIENVWNKFLLSPLEMRDLIDKADSKNVGAYFDVGNVIYSGYPEQWIKILGKRIKKVHLKDYRKNVGTLDGFVDLLSGDVNYPAVISALKNIGYDGWLTAEMGVYKSFPEAGIKNTYEAMKKIVNG